MRLEIQCEDRVGMAREVLDLFIPYQIDMKRIEVDTQRRCMYCAFPDIAFAQLQTLLAEIRRIEGVEDVKTVMFTPSEREHNALATLLRALPDGVISVDVQGNVVMATATALRDLAIVGENMVGQPLSRFIKGVRFNGQWSTYNSQMQSKRVRVNGQNVLLEMLPIFVPDQDGKSIPAGAVINVKSQMRLNQQTASLRRAPNADVALDEYRSRHFALSEAMKTCLRQAEAMTALDMPLYICGEAGVGKQELLHAMYQQWLTLQHDVDAELYLKNASELTVKEIQQLMKLSGWYVIQSPERLSPAVQQALIHYLKKQSPLLVAGQGFVRIVTVSCLTLNQLRQQHDFSSELLYLLSALTLNVPPLHQRKADIPGLVEWYMNELAERMQQDSPKLTKGAMVKLSLHHWPGNLNELRNACLQALVVSQRQQIGIEAFMLEDNQQDTMALNLLDGSLDKTMKHWEAKLLRELYPRFPSSRLLAKEVGLSHSAVANKLREYGIGSGNTLTHSRAKH